jgi:hypothetical protein
MVDLACVFAGFFVGTVSLVRQRIVAADIAYALTL